MRGTLINTATVLIGSTVGTAAGARIPENVRTLLLQAIGLITIVIGLQRALESDNVLILLGSVVLGGIVGEVLRIESGLERLGQLLARDRSGASEAATPISDLPLERGHQSTIARGFITASLIFCVGPMTILGSIEDGLSGSFETLAIKATLDGITSAVLASTLGWGVILAAATVFIFQGALTLGAGLLRGILTDAMVVEMTAAGGLMILGLGFNILQVTRIPVGNLLPGLAIAPILAALAAPRGG